MLALWFGGITYEGLFQVCGGSEPVSEFSVCSLINIVRFGKIIVRGDRVTNEREPQKTITATDLKQNLGVYLDHVMDNNEVVITKNGQKIARLVPYITSLEHYFYLREKALDYAVGGRKVSYEEFMEISEKSDLRMEFINGEIFLLSSPSIRHQRISGKLYILFSQYLQGKSLPWEDRLLEDLGAYCH
ncbi:MAG: type II toxin-antitoxin system prevent-host-death family antitoxin [Firmicutes bacterium]|nr:type II toxin-antitoxin system prevent-host-death family antitoxin [Bacillota bacterium]